MYAARNQQYEERIDAFDPVVAPSLAAVLFQSVKSGLLHHTAPDLVRARECTRLAAMYLPRKPLPYMIECPPRIERVLLDAYGAYERALGFKRKSSESLPLSDAEIIDRQIRVAPNLVGRVMKEYAHAKLRFPFGTSPHLSDSKWLLDRAIGWERQTLRQQVDIIPAEEGVIFMRQARRYEDAIGRSNSAFQHYLYPALCYEYAASLLQRSAEKVEGYREAFLCFVESGSTARGYPSLRSALEYMPKAEQNPARTAAFERILTAADDGRERFAERTHRIACALMLCDLAADGGFHESDINRIEVLFGRTLAAGPIDPSLVSSYLAEGSNLGHLVHAYACWVSSPDARARHLVEIMRTQRSEQRE